MLYGIRFHGKEWLPCQADDQSSVDERTTTYVTLILTQVTRPTASNLGRLGSALTRRSWCGLVPAVARDTSEVHDGRRDDNAPSIDGASIAEHTSVVHTVDFDVVGGLEPEAAHVRPSTSWQDSHEVCLKRAEQHGVVLALPVYGCMGVCVACVNTEALSWTYQSLDLDIPSHNCTVRRASANHHAGHAIHHRKWSDSSLLCS